MKNSRFLAFIFGLAVLSSCSTQRISNQNLAYLYDGDKALLDPDFVIGHTNDSVSYFDFRINSNELLYLQNPKSGYHRAEFRIRYEVISDMEARTLLDSTVILYHDSSLEVQSKIISGRIEMKPSTRASSILKIDLADNNRGTTLREFYEIDRRNHNCRQFFTVSKAGTNEAQESELVNGADSYTINHNLSKYRRATVRYYGREFPIAPPPFSVEPERSFDFAADSTFQYTFGQPVQFKQQGFYHFQVIDSIKDGFTLFNFKEGFPKVKKIDDLVTPLRILNSKNEFKKITEAEDTKLAIDRFWLKVAGDRQRARAMIEKYYGRVQEANEYFSSHVEGWKTDRGLIYLIYGPPNTMYKNSRSEIWIYGEEGNISSLNFNFARMQNPFTDRDYKLDRSPIFKNSWYQAVDSWRQGRIYTDN